MATSFTVVVEGGRPWGFTLQGGLEFRAPIRVGKVREGGREREKGDGRGGGEREREGGRERKRGEERRWTSVQSMYSHTIVATCMYYVVPHYMSRVSWRRLYASGHDLYNYRMLWMCAASLPGMNPTLLQCVLHTKAVPVLGG